MDRARPVEAPGPGHRHQCYCRPAPLWLCTVQSHASGAHCAVGVACQHEHCSGALQPTQHSTRLWLARARGPRAQFLVWSNIYVLSTLLRFWRDQSAVASAQFAAHCSRSSRTVHGAPCRRNDTRANLRLARTSRSARGAAARAHARNDLPRVYTSRVCAGLHVSVHSCAHASTH